MIGHADRAKPLRDYCLGLMMPCERKSVEPMAAITAPERTAAQHQSLLHFIGEEVDGERVLAKRRDGLPEIERHGRRSMDHRRYRLSKKGQNSVGVRENIAASLASRTTQVAVTCRSPITMRACRWPIGCIAEGVGERSQTSAQGRSS